MYKHTFYYFLGNKKYPEIYILQFQKKILLLYVSDQTRSIDDALNDKTSQELRMLSSVTINCQVRMIDWIQVLNCQDCNQCLKCQVSRTVFPIVKNCLNVIKYCHQKIVIKNSHQKIVIKKCHQVLKVLKVLNVLNVLKVLKVLKVFKVLKVLQVLKVLKVIKVPKVMSPHQSDQMSQW